jgi:hypothetical protein
MFMNKAIIHCHNLVLDPLTDGDTAMQRQGEVYKGYNG